MCASAGLEELDWIECNGAFVEADVIRFKEAVWERKGPRAKSRSVRVGEREVIAEVLHDDPDREGWVWLRVVRTDVLKAFKRRNMTLPVGSEIKRLRKNVLRRGVRRLAWSDESAREAVVREWKAGLQQDPRGR